MQRFHIAKLVTTAIITVCFSAATQAAPIKIGFSSDISTAGIFNLEWESDVTLANGTIKHLKYVRPVGFQMRVGISDQVIQNPVGDCPIVTVGAGLPCSVNIDRLSFPDTYQGGAIAIDRRTRQAVGDIRLTDWSAVGNDGFMYPQNLMYDPELDVLFPIESPRQDFPLVSLDLATSLVTSVPNNYGSVRLYIGSQSSPFPSAAGPVSLTPWRINLINSKATVSIPEPASFSLIGLGILGLATHRRRRHQR